MSRGRTPEEQLRYSECVQRVRIREADKKDRPRFNDLPFDAKVDELLTAQGQARTFLGVILDGTGLDFEEARRAQLAAADAEAAEQAEAQQAALALSGPAREIGEPLPPHFSLSVTAEMLTASQQLLEACGVSKVGDVPRL